MPPQRFILHSGSEGGHEHYLEPRKQRQTLSAVWRKLMDFGLPSSPANSPATAVDKYGKCQELLGSGASGTVWISRKRTANGVEELYAIKRSGRRPGEPNSSYTKRVMSEYRISSELRHPNVIRTLDLLHDEKEMTYTVMEFCAGGSLYMWIRSAGKFEVQEADCFFKQLMSGVQYMHEMGVAHRDLKPENLLLTAGGRLKIGDFDYSECFRTA